MIKWIFGRGGIFLFLVFFFAFQLSAQNLLVNPGAETANTNGWVDPDSAWSADAPISPHSGDYFFWPGRRAIPYTEIYQDVDVSSYLSIIDAGNAWFRLSGWLANWDQYPHDRSTLAIEALSAGGKQLLYLSRQHRGPSWTLYQIEAKIPAGTRTLRVHLIATRFVGVDNDGYFDDLSLEVITTAPSGYVIVSSEKGLMELPVDSTLQLHAQTVGGTDVAYTWSSSFDAIATVDSNGLVTAHKAGTFTIQAIGKTTGRTGYLALTAYNPNYIIFREPKAGAQWIPGSIQEIKWEMKGTLDSGTLSFSLNGGTDWMEIATIDTLGSGHYFWQVPDSNRAYNDCYLKITWNDGESVSPNFAIAPNATGVQEKKRSLQPLSFELISNFPNPFNPKTTIHYGIRQAGIVPVHVRLNVYDIRGNHVAELVNAFQTSGDFYVDFFPMALSSGVYLYQLQVGSHIKTGKMLLEK